jgi:hypothetical protein
MVRERRTKQAHDPMPSDTESEEEIEVTPPPKRSRQAVRKVPARQASQRGGPSGQRGGSSRRARVEQTNVPQAFIPVVDYPPLQRDHRYEIHAPEYAYSRQGVGIRRKDYTKKHPGVHKERRENPYEYEKFIPDRRFWSQFQADWYSSVILEKQNPITVSKYVNWNEMASKEDSTFELVISECQEKNLYFLLGMKQDWNNELIGQFVSTAWFEGEGKETFIHFTLQGIPYYVSYRRFAEILGLEGTLNEVELHNEIEPTDEEFQQLYLNGEEADLDYTHGMRPYTKILNRLFRETLTPKRGDRSKIHGSTRVLLCAMNFERPRFNVFGFFWNELMFMLHHGKHSVVYAPYIQKMINVVTGMEFGYDEIHAPYTPKLPTPPSSAAQSPSTSTESPASQASPPAQDIPVTSDMPSSSRARPRKKGNALVRGLKAIFSMCSNTNDVVRSQARATQTSINRIEEHLNIERTAWPELPPSPPRDNPWAWYDEQQEGEQDEEEDEDDE